MRASPVTGVVLLIGVGAIWVAEKKGTRDEVQPVPMVRRMVEKEARQEARANAPQAPAGNCQVLGQSRKVATCSAKPVLPRGAVPGKTVRMLVTAYCACEICCEGWSKFARTATGKDAQICDGVAADPKLLPYRTKLDIPGVGLREVDDTGGAMRQDAKRGITHIDVRMASHSEARRFGVKLLDVKILK